MVRRSHGFTIIELLIATLAFSLVIIVVTSAVIRFSKQYYQSIIASSTQDTARAIIDDVTRSIQFNSGGLYPISATAPSGGYCLGMVKRYSYKLNQQVTDDTPRSGHQGAHGLVVDAAPGCTTGSGIVSLAPNAVLAATIKPRELLGQHMRLAKFDITQKGDLYSLTVKVVYGDDDLLNTTDNSKLDEMQCKPGAGAEYCAVSELSTTINKRIK